MEPNYFVELAVTHLLPFVAFLVGVIIADRIGLYPKLQRTKVWLMSMPTGCLSTGLLISSASIQLHDVTYYGYMSSPEKYLVFIGIIMFYGIAVPELFAAFRGLFSDTAKHR